jgi:pimeloyl-ACP methyl ester carboxylesterase
MARERALSYDCAVDHDLDERFLHRYGELPRSLRVAANGTELHLLQWGDLRGHGESAHTSPYGHEVYSQDIAALVDALQLEHPIILGHSMGGSVTVRAASRLGSRLRALVLVDAGLGPPPRLSMRPPEPARSAEREPMVFRSWEQARARFKLRPGDTVAAPELLDHLARHAIKELPDGTFSWRFDPNLRQQRGPMGSTPDGSTIRCPVMSIWGAHSPMLGRVDPRDIGERFPSAAWTTVEMIDGAHHHVFLDQPEAFNRVLQKQLAAVRG